MHIYRRGKVYYYRIKIPKYLISHFKKQEIHKSLKTINKLIAYKYVKILQTHFEFIKQGILMNKLTSDQIHSAVSNFISLKFEETEVNFIITLIRVRKTDRNNEKKLY